MKKVIHTLDPNLVIQDNKITEFKCKKLYSAKNGFAQRKISKYKTMKDT